jgi:hypothetical protein
MSQLFKTKPPSIVMTGIKALLASGAVMGVIGLWSSISNETINDFANNDQELNQNDETSLNMSSLPTLASLNLAIETVLTPAAEPSQTLRDVSVLPTATPAVQSVQIQTVTINMNPQNSTNKSSVKKKSSANSRSS